LGKNQNISQTGPVNQRRRWSDPNPHQTLRIQNPERVRKVEVQSCAWKMFYSEQWPVRIESEREMAPCRHGHWPLCTSWNKVQ